MAATVLPILLTSACTEMHGHHWYTPLKCPAQQCMNNAGIGIVFVQLSVYTVQS